MVVMIAVAIRRVKIECIFAVFLVRTFMTLINKPLPFFTEQALLGPGGGGGDLLKYRKNNVAAPAI